MGRIQFLAAFAAVALVTSGCVSAHSAPDLLASYHFIGASALATNANAAKLNEVFKLPKSALVRDAIQQKVAGVPQLFGLPLSPRDTNAMALMRPMLDDVLSAESIGEARRGGKIPGEVVFAIRLNDARAALWQTNLTKLLSTAAQGKVSRHEAKQFSGWNIKRSEAPNLVRVVRAKEWLVVGVGPKDLPLHDNFLQKIQSTGRPGSLGTNWLEATVDWPALRQWLPEQKSWLNLGRTHFTVSGKDDNLRTVAKIAYLDPLKWSPYKWQIPTNLIRDPLVSFTAGNNVAPFVNPHPLIQQAGSNPLTNQFFVWAQAPMPFMSFFAVPEKPATNAMKRVSSTAPKLFNPILKQRRGGTLVQATNGFDLIWKEIPLISPFLIPVKEPNEYLFGGLFPKQGGTNPPPRELFAQFSTKTNLVYYDWELTEVRLGQWQLLSEVLPIFASAVPFKDLDPAGRERRRARGTLEPWQGELSPLLGNTITEVLVTGPKELTLTRKSHLGLTGFEIVMFTDWLASSYIPAPGVTNAAPSTPAAPAPVKATKP